MSRRRAASYVRCGLDDAVSLKAQEKQIEAHSVQNGWKLVEQFVDEGMSEFMQRPGLMQLQSKAQVGVFDVLVVTEPRRLFACPERVSSFVRLLRRQYGVEVVFLEGGAA